MASTDIQASSELFKHLASNLSSFSQFLDFFPGVVYRSWVNDGKGEIIYINDHIESLSGYKSSQFLSGEMTMSDLFSQKDLELVTKEFDLAMAKGNDFIYEYTIKHKQGKALRVVSYSHVTRDIAGNPETIDGIIMDVTRHRELEEELARVISINQNLIDASSNIIFTKSSEGVFRLVNKAMCDFLGLQPEQIIGHTDETLGVDEKKLKQYLAEDKHVLDSGKSLIGDIVEIEMDGEKHWFRAMKSPIRNAKGSIEGVLGIVTDITDLVLAEKKVSEKEKLLNMVYNTSKDFIAVLEYKNGEYYYVSCNQAYEELLASFGVKTTSKELEGVNLLKHALENGVFTESKLKQAKQDLDSVVSSNEEKSITEITPIPGTDLKIYIDTTISPVLDDSGKLQYLIYNGHDFTNLVSFNQQLQEREELIASINRNINDGIYRSSVSNGLTYTNDAMNNLFGYSYLEMRKVHPAQFYNDPNDRHQIIQQLNQTGRFVDKEVKFKRKDGSTFWGKLSCSMTIEKNGNRVIDGIVVDITRDREIRQKLSDSNSSLRKINSELDHLVYRTSHDLRSPLASIMGLLELVRMEGVDGEVLNYLGMMDDQLKRLDKVIMDIINIRKIAKNGVQSEQLDLRLMIEEAFESIKFLSQFNSISQKVTVAPDLVISQDQTNLQFVLNNLISNAVKYCDENKEEKYISVDVVAKGEGCTITIEDNGIGIDGDHLDKVFDMFYRATSKNTGTGLGLFIVQEAIQKLKGQVTVESEFGMWTRFTIDLPNI